MFTEYRHPYNMPTMTAMVNQLLALPRPTMKTVKASMLRDGELVQEQVLVIDKDPGGLFDLWDSYYGILDDFRAWVLWQRVLRADHKLAEHLYNRCRVDAQGVTRGTVTGFRALKLLSDPCLRVEGFLTFKLPLTTGKWDDHHKGEAHRYIRMSFPSILKKHEEVPWCDLASMYKKIVLKHPKHPEAQGLWNMALRLEGFILEY